MSATDTSLIRVLLIDNHTVVRAGLRLLLETCPRFCVVGDVGTIAEAILVARREQPDIILFDAATQAISPVEAHWDGALSDNKATVGDVSGSLTTVELAANGTPVKATSANAISTTVATPQPVVTQHAAPELAVSPLFSFIANSLQDSGAITDGVDFIPALLEAAPRAQIIVLTGSSDTQLHRRSVVQGAKGLLQKECAPELLMHAIECVNAGEVWMKRTTMASVFATFSQHGSTPNAPDPASLTVRERQVIALLCEGMPDSRIASHLAISETTVRRHLTSIFGKLGITDRLELVIYAYRHGLADIIEA